MGGYLLAAQRLGFEVLGFEPSKEHARVALKHFSLPVISEYFTPDLVENKTFDLIMLSHVIEHIFDPKSFLRDLVGVLKPGGVLIVITPNSDSIIARLTGASWPMMKPMDHVSLISAKAYDFFELNSLANIHHRYSEYRYEFAATLAAVLKAKLKGDGPHDSEGAQPLSPNYSRSTLTDRAGMRHRPV